MSALALILINRGYCVSGSDEKNNESTERLRQAGVEIFKSQKAENIQTIYERSQIPPLIISSSAIKPTNPELKAASDNKLEIWHRSDLLAYLINQQSSILVAGSHGKTTTSTLLTTLLALTKQDPTSSVGGIIPLYNSNAHAGKGKLLIAEADESDGTLIKFEAELGLITNIELDHTDHYSSLEELIITFKKFGKGCNQVLANSDCDALKNNIEATYWWSTKTTEGVHFACLPKSITGNETTADFYEEGILIGEITLKIPGLHNLSNATGAIAACRIAGIDFNDLKHAVSLLQFPSRRFDFRGNWKGRQIVDDYAHHPSEIKATISMARLMINSGNSPLPQISNRLVAVFQPHRYSRTKDFIKDFALALSKADLVLIAPIFDAGETPIKGISSERLGDFIKIVNPNLPIFTATSMDELINIIKEVSSKNDLILNMGAGDINTVWQRLYSENKKDESSSTLLAA